MGMHNGIIAAKTSWQSLLQVLSESEGKFVDRGAVRDINASPIEKNEDSIIAGEFAGCAFIIDTSLILSSSPDVLLAVSQRLQTTVASCVGETVSGTFALFVADKGNVLRHYWNCHSDMSEPYSIGSPLSSEANTPLEDIDGVGLHAALQSVGLDVDAWYEAGTKRAYLWETDDSYFARPDGPLQSAFNTFYRTHKIQGPAPKPKVVSRKLPDGSIGFDIVSSRQPAAPADPPKRPAGGGSWFRRLFRG
jgi:hypothetical protein